MREALLIVAAILVTIGVALVYLPAGVITAGLLLGALMLWSDD